MLSVTASLFITVISLTTSHLTSPWMLTYFALIAGGKDAVSNDQSHQEHLMTLITTLEQHRIPSDQITLFWADGTSPEVDRRLPEPQQNPVRWVVQDTPWEGWFDRPPLLANTTWRGFDTRPAHRSAIRAWLQELSPKIKQGDTVLIAVTDHGAPDPKNGWRTSVELWGEQLGVEDLYQDLQHLPSEVTIQLWMSQCYSGGFARIAMMDPRVCGAFSSTAKRPAYGCFSLPPQRGIAGHFISFTQAFSQSGRLDLASRSTAERDETPDTPHLSSDAFARQVLKERSEALGIPPEHIVDQALPLSSELNEAQRSIVESITQISLRFHLGLVHSYSKAIQLQKEISNLTYALSSWHAKWSMLTREARLRLLHKSPVEGFTQEIQKRRSQIESARLTRWIKQALSRGDEGRRGLLKDLYQRTQRAERLLDQLKTIEAALWRVSTLYITLAAQRSLNPHDQALWERMRQCEARQALTPLTSFRSHQGSTDDHTRVASSFPSLNEIYAEVEALRPGHLAFQFRERSRAKLLEVRGLDLGSPLWAVDLKVGDLIDMIDGKRLSYLGQMREEVALQPIGEWLKVRRRRQGESRVLHLPVVGMPSSPKPPQRGEHIPPLSLDPILEEEPMHHWMTGGRSTLLFFWATWCKRCLSVTPQLKRWAHRHNLQVLAVTTEDPHLVKAVSHSSPLPFPILHDRGGEVTRLFDADLNKQREPVFVYLDVERRFIERGVGMGPRGPTQIELLFE